MMCEATQPEPCGQTAQERGWKTTACQRFHRLCDGHQQELYDRSGTPAGMDLYRLIPHAEQNGRSCPPAEGATS